MQCLTHCVLLPLQVMDMLGPSLWDKWNTEGQAMDKVT